MGRRTVTLVAAPLGSLLPGRPVDWNQLPPEALQWADQQADNGNEMVTVIEGDHRAELRGNYDVYLATMALASAAVAHVTRGGSTSRSRQAGSSPG